MKLKRLYSWSFYNISVLKAARSLSYVHPLRPESEFVPLSIVMYFPRARRRSHWSWKWFAFTRLRIKFINITFSVSVSICSDLNYFVWGNYFCSIVLFRVSSDESQLEEISCLIWIKQKISYFCSNCFVW